MKQYKASSKGTKTWDIHALSLPLLSLGHWRKQEEGGQNHKDGGQEWTTQYQEDNQVSQDSPAHSGNKASQSRGKEYRATEWNGKAEKSQAWRELLSQVAEI